MDTEDSWILYIEISTIHGDETTIARWVIILPLRHVSSIVGWAISKSLIYSWLIYDRELYRMTDPNISKCSTHIQIYDSFGFGL